MAGQTHDALVLHKLGTFEVRTESLDEALELVRAFADEVGRKEGGTAGCEFYQDAARPTRFLHHLRFRVASAEDYHNKTAWRKRFHDALLPLCTQPPSYSTIKPVESA